MSTTEKIRANRENAKKSTGPRTAKGKTRSSQNALKHGLLAQDAVLPGEDPAEFDQHLTSFEDTYLPRNRVEKEIVRQIADVSWRMQRLSRIETAVIAAGIENTRRFDHDTGPMPEDRQERTKILGWAILTRTKLLNNLARYDGHLGRRFFRGVELMIDIRRDDRQLREAYEAKNAGATTPVHYLPDDDPSPSRPSAIGFRPAEKSGPISRDVPSAEENRSTELSSIAGAKRTVPHFFAARQSTNPTNQKIQNEPKINLTTMFTTTYKPTTATVDHAIQAGLR